MSAAILQNAGLFAGSSADRLEGLGVRVEGDRVVALSSAPLAAPDGRVIDGACRAAHAGRGPGHASSVGFTRVRDVGGGRHLRAIVRGGAVIKNPGE